MNLFAAADHAIDAQVAATKITPAKNVFHRYLPVSELLPDSLFAPPVRVEDEDDCDTDTAWIDAPRPGSDRVAAFANHYQNSTDNSAFVLTNDEMSQRMVDSLMNGNIDLKSPLGAVLSSLFIECLEECGELPQVN